MYKYVYLSSVSLFIVCVVTSIKTLWVIKCFWEKYTPFIFSHAKLVSLLLVLATIYFYILSDISLLSSAEKILLCKILLNDLEVQLGGRSIWSHTILPFNSNITSRRPLEANFNLHLNFSYSTRKLINFTLFYIITRNFVYTLL